MIQVDVGSDAGLKPGDVGLVYFESEESGDPVEVGTGRVVEAEALSATVEVDESARVQPGHLVRFEIPDERLAQPADDVEPPAPRDGPEPAVFVAADVDPCLNLRASPDRSAQQIDCLPAGTEAAVIEDVPGWKKARLADGREGWLAEAFLTSSRAAPVELGAEPSRTVTRRPADLSDLDRMRWLLEEARAALSQSEAAQIALARQLEEVRQEGSGEPVASEAVAELRARLAQADGHFEKIRGRRLSLQKALGEAERARLSLTRRILEETAADLEAQLQQAADDLQQSAGERSHLIERLDQANAELEAVGARLAAADLGQSELRGERERLAVDLEALQAKADADRRGLEADMGELRQQIDLLEERSEESRRELAAREQTIDELTGQLADFEQVRLESAELLSEKDRLAAQLATLSALLADAELGQNKLRGERDQLAADLDTLRTDAARDRQTLDAAGVELRQRIEALEEQAAGLTRDLVAREQTIEGLTLQLEDLEEAGARSAETIADKDARLAELQALESRLRAAELDRSELRGERDRLAVELGTLRADAAADRQTHEAAGLEFQQRVDRLEKRSDGLTRELVVREQTIDDLTQQLDSLRQGGRESYQAVAENERLLSELRAALEEVQSRRLDAEERASALGSRSKELELRLQRAGALIAELNRQLDEQARIRGDRQPSVEAPISSSEVAARFREPSSPANVEQAIPARPEARSPASSNAATRVERITWRQEGDAVSILIYFDGEIAAEDCEVLRLREGQPRDVLKIRGIREVFSPSTLEVSTDLVRRIRTGLHSEGERTTLHVVTDLSRSDVGVRSVSVRSRMLVVTVS